MSKGKLRVFMGFSICVYLLGLGYILATRYIGMLQAPQKLHTSINDNYTRFFVGGNLESQQTHMYKNEAPKKNQTNDPSHFLPICWTHVPYTRNTHINPSVLWSYDHLVKKDIETTANQDRSLMQLSCWWGPKSNAHHKLLSLHGFVESPCDYLLVSWSLSNIPAKTCINNSSVQFAW